MYVSRHHPVSNNSPINHPGVSSKWSRKQDQKLRQAVEKYGTQWSIISRKYRFDRSVNSLVKRWHGKLKDQAQKGVSNHSESSDQVKQQKSQHQKSKRIRKRQKNQLKMQKPKSRRGGYRPRRPRESQQIKQNRERSRGRKPSNVEKQQKQVKQSEKKKMQAIEEEINNNMEKYQGEMKEMENDSVDESESNFVFQHKWKENDDKMLKEMILNDYIFKWQELAAKLRVQNIREVRKRWQYNVYPQIIQQRKIGGCLKYSEEEDAILSRGVKLGMTVLELRKFLPGRTEYSLEARRRRTLRMDEEQTPELRYWTKKLLAYKFVEKRHQHLQKPTEENQFFYRSDSQ